MLRQILQAVVGLVSVSCATAATPPGRTLTVDVVELVAGREVPGREDLRTLHEGIEYRFATQENKDKFEQEPAKFEVADGGACGRMGPLSGVGDARRHAVHAGRVYFFASDSCREWFLKEPAAYIETDDEMPFGRNEQVLAGRATLDKLVGWAGGAERLKKVSTYRATAERTEVQGGKDWAVTNETVILFPRSYYQKEAWNESWFSTASGPDGGVMASSRGRERIASSRTRAFERVMARTPIAIIKAHVDGSVKADCPGLVVIGDGEGEVGGATVEFVRVWLNGAASRLAVEKASGRLLRLEYRGRDASMNVGDVVRTYTKHATAEGVTLPTACTATLDGKEIARAATTIDAFELDVEASPGLFRVPAWD